ncbi:hypothetical protein HPB47_005902 [Ixodes persulcatus]|uniref:Uncharacterized protein n=1 Tax=Ixodes persulcatus TaxID=34615 RepID=A0AC60PCI4_IXOPE|nr:hypothetical protein HPB47_005902 [Ixodes persulcatus]
MTITYVANSIPTIQLETEQHNSDKQEMVAIECQLQGSDTKLVVINAYWIPGYHHSKTNWIKDFKDKHKGKDLIIEGDFNCHHTAWGYSNTTPNGRRLEAATGNNNLSLLNDIHTPTRTGNSVEKDTNPDLTWHIGPNLTRWENTLENLGSDHYILITQLKSKSKRKKERGSGSRTGITKWEKLREDLENEDASEDPSTWAEEIKTAYQKHTKHITKTEEAPLIDRHLLEQWDKRRKVGKRLKKNKINKHLKNILRSITEEAEDYASKLANENWLQLRDGLNGLLHTPRVWQIL